MFVSRVVFLQLLGIRLVDMSLGIMRKYCLFTVYTRVSMI